MNIIIENAGWMIFNSYLALVPVLFCWLFLKIKRRFYRIILGFIWLVYLPNTIYVFTDLHHLIEQWGSLTFDGKFIVLIQYGILEVIGLSAFIVAFYPFEKILMRYTEKKSRNIDYSILIVLNFIIGFAMVIGKVERVNSWEMFTATEKVIVAVNHLLNSSALIALGILFGLFSNFFYFLFRKPLYHYFLTIFKKIRVYHPPGGLA